MPSNEFFALALTFCVAFAIATGLVLSAGRHGHLTLDAPGAIQKVHQNPTPRVGGIAVYLALVVGWLAHSGHAEGELLATVLLAGLPAFLAGLVEDLTKRAGVASRLLLTLFSGAAATWATQSGIERLGVPLADVVLSAWPAAVVVTAIAVGGVSNAINIIDGYHGLASGTVMIALAGLAAIAVLVGDRPLAVSALLLNAAVAGFWVLNYPWGKLFLGDGGAYFCGFGLAWLSVQLLARNSEVSPWASVLLCGYPTLEVLYSIVRRRKARGSASMADHGHLHSLVDTVIVQPRMAKFPPDLRNATVAVVMWPGAFATVVPAILFFDRPVALLLVMSACTLAYHLLYRKAAAAAKAWRASAGGQDMHAVPCTTQQATP